MPKDWQRAVEKCHCRCYDEGRDVNALWGFGRYAKAVAIIVDDGATAFLLLIAALYALIVLYITEVWRKLYQVADKTTEHNKLTKYEYTNKLS